MRLAIALLLGATGAAVAATQPISDTDLWWHLATGRETLAHGLVRTDLFSWTVRGAPVSTDQWLGQVILYGAYALLGWWGIALLRIAAVASLLALVVWNASIPTRRRPIVLLGAAFAAFIESRVLWVDRPELLGLVCFAALLPLLRLGRAGNMRAFAGCIALLVLWANIHGSFALGVVLTLLVCAEGAWRDVTHRRAYVLAAFGALVASLLTPAGVGTWTAPGFHLLTPPRDIQEWALIDPRSPLGIAYLITLALTVIAIVRIRPDLRELVVVVPVALLSLTAVRQAPLLAIVTAPLFADIADRIARTRPAGATRRGTVGLSALAVVLAVLALFAAPRQPDESAYPVAVLNSLPNGDGMLARYEWGGWLIWRAPGTPVFVDGRLTPYLGGVIEDYQRVIAAAPGFQDTLARRNVRTLLVTPTDPVALRAEQLGWRVMSRSPQFILIAVP